MTIVLSSQDKSHIAYRQFVETCRSPATRSMYSNALRYFMSYLKIPVDRYDKLLDLDTKIIQMNICDYITHLKNSGVIASRSIAVYLSAIRKKRPQNSIIRSQTLTPILLLLYQTSTLNPITIA
jgi:hypothetical protein